MNLDFKKIKEEDVLFFDIETVRRSKELEVDSREFDLFRSKTKNKDTDKYLNNIEVVELYKRKAALYLGYATIVSIGVGFIQKDTVYIKDITGDEEYIIREFCNIASKFKYVCGFNIKNYDLPQIMVNGFRYFDVSQVLPDRFVTAGKKPWEMGSVIDLMDVYKGTYYINPSLDEALYNFGIESPKDKISGADVSEEFWKNGVKAISEYVKKDVFATINLFKAMNFEKTFNNFIDRESNEEEITPIRDFKNNKRLTKELMIALKERKPKLEDKELIKNILLAGTLPIKGRVNEQKEQANIVEHFIKELYDNA